MAAYRDGRMLIGGSMVESADGAWLDSVSPADESILGRVPEASSRDGARAVDAAVAAQPAWDALGVAGRAAPLLRLAAAIEARGEEIAALEAEDTGNTIGPMRGDVANAVERIRFAVGLAYEMKGQTVPSTPGGLHLTIRVPFGVVGRIVPFNHPVMFAASRIAAACVSGNTTVVKPSEQSPLSATILGELCAEHLPPGVANIVTGGRGTGEALVRDPRVKRIAFIGSPASGMAIQRAAAEVAVKAVTLELGGKNPLIAFPDADPDRVAAAAVAGMNFGWQGQSCGSTSRILLHEDIHDAVLGRILDHVRRIRVGHPLDPQTTMGPVNSRPQYEKVLRLIEAAKEDGARLVHGGGRPAGEAFRRGFWVEPTVFADVQQGMRIAREEVFGPVMSVLRFRTEDEAVAVANGVDLGLTAAIFTDRLDLALRTARRVQAGYVWINGVSAHYRGMPFGGMKNSGIGREEGLEELLSYTEEKAISFVGPARPS